MDCIQNELDYDYPDYYELYHCEEERRLNSLPKLLFKYKAVSTAADIDRLIDILQKNQIYMPNYKQLNDPLEGTNAKLLGIDQSVRDEEREKWQILAFSEDCLLPTLWAYYAGNYTGVCLGFKTYPAFQNVIKVEYVNNQMTFQGDEPLFLEDDFKYKNRCWFYEKEWRFIRRSEYTEDKTVANQFIDFAPEDIVHIFIGYEMPENLKRMISESAPSTAHLWVVKPCCEGFGLIAESKKSGKVIHTVEELTED